MRATICVETERDTDKDEAARWFEDWRDALTYVSSNRGCGCCVDLIDVEGSKEAISRLPPHVRCSSDWSSGARERSDAGGEMNPYRSRLA